MRIWIVTHSDFLAEALQNEIGKRARRVVKLDGATSIEWLKLSPRRERRSVTANGRAFEQR
jgi:predicted ATPase